MYILCSYLIILFNKVVQIIEVYLGKWTGWFVVRNAYFVIRSQFLLICVSLDLPFPDNATSNSKWQDHAICLLCQFENNNP